MDIRVYNDGQLVYTGSVTQFLEDNQYDEDTVEMVGELKEKAIVECDFYHSGNWRIEKI